MLLLLVAMYHMVMIIIDNSSARYMAAAQDNLDMILLEICSPLRRMLQLHGQQMSDCGTAPYPYRRSISCSSANQSSVTRVLSADAMFTIMDLDCESRTAF